MENKRYGIVLADDHKLFREGLRTLLDNDPDYAILAEASDGMELLRILETTEPDVIMLDIDMPGMDGMEAASKALEMNPALKIITLSMHGEEEYYFRMVNIGVKGFVLKNCDIDELKSAISVVSNGGSYFSQELLQLLVGSLKTTVAEDQDPDKLSARENEILLMICRGMSNQEIGDSLFISKRTVDKHRANILYKTNCKNTANLVVYAIKNKLVEI